MVTMSENDGNLYTKDLIREMSLKIRDSPKRKGSDSPGFLRPSPRNSPMRKPKNINWESPRNSPVVVRKPSKMNFYEEIGDPNNEEEKGGDLLKSIQEEMKSPGRGEVPKVDSGKTPELEDPAGNTSVA